MLWGSDWGSAGLPWVLDLNRVELGLGTIGAEHVDEVFWCNWEVWRGRDDMVNPLNLTLMHRSHQVPQLQGMTNCLLQLVSPPTRRASYLTTWACCGGRPGHVHFDRPIRTRSKARTNNN